MRLRPAVATVCLGRSSAGHTLFQKLQQAARYSFQGVEIFDECLKYHAEALPGGLTESNLLTAAKQTRVECDRLGLEVVCLQPFMYAEGLTSADERKKVIQKLRLWFKIAKTLGTDMIQIPTNFQPHGTTGDLERVTADLAEFTRLAAKESPVIRIAYEGVSWGKHIDTWEGAWEVVKRVDMPNLGLCLDTFHIAGRVWADPSSPTGRNPRGDKALAATLTRMARELDVDKIFYIQAGDAEKLDSPLRPGENPLYVPGQPERMTWSRNARLFPFETDQGAYLPVTIILDVIINILGYRGWVSLESFHAELFVEDELLPEQYAKRGQRAWNILQQLYNN
jgi:4-hydroxyphenylpyruvate dioxygenase